MSSECCECPCWLAPPTKPVPWGESPLREIAILGQPLIKTVHSFQTSNVSEVHYGPGPAGDTEIKATDFYVQARGEVK